MHSPRRCVIDQQDPRQWYAVHVRSNQERQVASYLAGHGVELFLPSYRGLSTRKDREQVVEKILFPGYLFVKIAIPSAQKVAVQKAPGTVRIVGFGDGATPIDEETINSVKILVGVDGEDQGVKPHPLIQVGQTVRVISGPFKGAVGRIDKGDREGVKLVVEITFLCRAVCAPILSSQVEPVL